MEGKASWQTQAYGGTACLTILPPDQTQEAIMNIQYLGFEQNPKWRTYSFRVIETLKKDRQFQLHVDNQAVTNIKFKLQDIPDLCFSKLKRDLAVETADQLLPLQIRISESELQQYITIHYPAKQRRG